MERRELRRKRRSCALPPSNSSCHRRCCVLPAPPFMPADPSLSRHRYCRERGTPLTLSGRKEELHESQGRGSLCCVAAVPPSPPNRFANANSFASSRRRGNRHRRGHGHGFQREENTMRRGGAVSRFCRCHRAQPPRQVIVVVVVVRSCHCRCLGPPWGGAALTSL
ncbi:uncharacterized protein DS421_16g550570 [Arachis hypogaea]|nr:uncharacterized protein DS421_16g550570 [Arachis hypogaea]